jgi:hypothetical protein
MDIGEAFFCKQENRGIPRRSAVLPAAGTRLTSLVGRIQADTATSGAMTLRHDQDSFLAFRTCRPLYMPVFKSR